MINLDTQFDESTCKKLSMDILAATYHQSIHRYEGMTFVVKYGGAAMISDELREAFAEEVVFLKQIGINMALVHGGGKEITAIAERMGLTSTFVEGQRYTDAAMVNVVQMVLAGKLNQDIVVCFNRFGGSAVGVTGLDSGLLNVRKDATGVDLGFVGEIVDINTAYLTMLMENGCLPVIAPIGTDGEGQVYNINADVAAAEIARHLGADKLFLLSDVDGVHASGKRLGHLDESAAARMIVTGEITNGMIPKMRSAFAALRNGVGSVHLVDGRVKHSLLRELCSDQPFGTELMAERTPAPMPVKIPALPFNRKRGTHHVNRSAS